MFRAATNVFVAAREKNATLDDDDEEQDLWDMVSTLQAQLPWVQQQHVPEAVFFEFFTCLVKARAEWELNPTYPYDRWDEYDPAILELIKFREAVGDRGSETSWILTDAIIYNEMADGLGEGEEEEEEQGGEGQNEGMVAAAPPATTRGEEEGDVETADLPMTNQGETARTGRRTRRTRSNSSRRWTSPTTSFSVAFPFLLFFLFFAFPFCLPSLHIPTGRALPELGVGGQWPCQSTASEFGGIIMTTSVASQR
ncbi:hypothetical protein F5Y17DRAFT_434903 [Xylariaceae sp. FL0594]|nr:hypothetical protein F5Y17DRAFT_434903 [Xylariaceae sp. FL0594]